LDLKEAESGSTLRILSLFSKKNATPEEIVLLIKTIVSFCHKKGWGICKKRPKREAKKVTILPELYE
jgi:hypothetical protein